MWWGILASALYSALETWLGSTSKTQSGSVPALIKNALTGKPL